MRDWRGRIEKSIQQKRLKLNQNLFEKFSQNCLMIYDFPSLLNDQITYKRAVLYLNELFTQPHNRVDFNTVFILSSHYLFRWCDRKLDVNYYTG